MAAPKEIVDLVERFDSNIASYKDVRYNETQVRREFIDPFFKALGWDIDNEQGFAEAFSAVFVERTPIRTIDRADSADLARHDRMFMLVDRMHSLNKQSPN